MNRGFYWIGSKIENFLDLKKEENSISNQEKKERFKITSHQVKHSKYYRLFAYLQMTHMYKVNEDKEGGGLRSQQ